MTPYICPSCGYSIQVLVSTVEAAHRCQKERTAGGQPKLVALVPGARG